MEKKRFIGIALLALLLAGGLSWFLNRSREPMCDGKPLTYWLECYMPENRTETSVVEADHALQAIGTNAIPTLLELLRREDSPLTVKCMNLLKKQKWVKIHWHEAPNCHMCAIEGFRVLGISAHSAVPSLIRTYQSSHSRLIRYTAVMSLGRIGPAAKEAVPLLISALDDDGRFYRWVAIVALGRIHSDPGRTLPALMKCFDDPASRLGLLYGLRELGPMAKPAVPKLIAHMNEENDPKVLDLYRSALRKIDPNSDPKAASESGDLRAAHP